VFGSIDGDTLLEASLAKRLHGREQIADERELQRLYRYLVGQGFEPDRVLAVLKARRSAR
jgi:SOS response regulatory protein OraA/RecX